MVVRPSVVLGRKIALLRQRQVAVSVVTGLAGATVLGWSRGVGDVPGLVVGFALGRPGSSAPWSAGWAGMDLWRRVVGPWFSRPTEDDLALNDGTGSAGAALAPHLRMQLTRPARFLRAPPRHGPTPRCWKPKRSRRHLTLRTMSPRDG